MGVLIDLHSWYGPPDQMVAALEPDCTAPAWAAAERLAKATEIDRLRHFGVTVPRSTGDRFAAAAATRSTGLERLTGATRAAPSRPRPPRGPPGA